MKNINTRFYFLYLFIFGIHIIKIYSHEFVRVGRAVGYDDTTADGTMSSTMEMTSQFTTGMSYDRLNRDNLKCIIN